MATDDVLYLNRQDFGRNRPLTVKSRVSRQVVTQGSVTAMRTLWAGHLVMQAGHIVVSTIILASISRSAAFGHFPNALALGFVPRFIEIEPSVTDLGERKRNWCGSTQPLPK